MYKEESIEKGEREREKGRKGKESGGGRRTSRRNREIVWFGYWQVLPRKSSSSSRREWRRMTRDDLRRAFTRLVRFDSSALETGRARSNENPRLRDDETKDDALGVTWELLHR